jgi:hypothetical protein
MLEISLLGTLGSEKMKMRRIEAGCIATLKKSNDIGGIKKIERETRLHAGLIV